MQTFSTDIVIIGSGPVGLFTVFEAGMLKMNCHVVDSLEEIGGQCKTLYPEKPIYDIPAHPNISASDLIDKLVKQAAPFNPVYHLGHRVESFEQLDDGWKVTTSKDHIIHAKAIVIAAGCGAFGPNRPPLQNLEAYEGTSVFYHVQEKERFRNAHVVIAGGGDSAVDWAISLVDIAKQVSVVHRRDKFRALPGNVDKLKQLVADGRLELVTPYQLSTLRGHEGRLSAIEVKTLSGDKTRTLEAEYLLSFFGLSMNIGPISAWGLTLEKNHIVIDPATCESSIAGIYAIGDIATYPGKLKLILCGFSEAAMCTHAIFHRIHPDTHLNFEYSTNKGIPKAL